MGAVPGNVISCIGKSIPDEGFRFSEPIKLTDFRTSAGLILTASTDPEISAVSSFVCVGVQEDSDAAPLLTLTLPGHFSSKGNFARLSIIAATGATPTGGHTLTLSGYRERAGASQVAITSSTGAVTIAGTALAQYDFLIEAASAFAAYDCLNILLTPNANATRNADINIYGAAFEYSTVLALYTESRRHN